MKSVLTEKILDRFENPVNNPRDCDLLSEEIYKRTGRNISSTTLRRFFGMLNSKSELSNYSLDTLAIFCGSSNYKNFCNEFGLLKSLVTHNFEEIVREIEQLTKFTLNSISRKSLTKFSKTIPRRQVNDNLNSFLASEFTVVPIIAPGGYGKTVAITHWIKTSIIEKKKALFLFIQAGMLSQILNNSKHSSGVLNLNLSDGRNLIQQFLENKQESLQYLVLAIDGLDEPENDARKIIQLASFIQNAASQFHQESFLKIVLIIREVTWNKFLMPELANKNPDWLMYSKVDSFESGHSNLPVLSNSEVKEIIGLYNKNQKKILIYESIDWRLREMIRIPLNLYFLTTLISKSFPIFDISADQLMLEFINGMVFKARFSEEKTDILWKLIEFSLGESAGLSIRKSRLKEIYPIHLKKESNYFTAYQDLLAMGILNEVQVENKYGLHVIHIRFRHANFYYYLTALYFVDSRQIIDKQLFQYIIDFKYSVVWTSNVIAYVYQIAFTNEEFEALKDFCNLDESILSSLPVKHTVGASFRQNNSVRLPIINEYVKHPKGQDYFFERFVDTNYLFNNFEYRIRKYLNYKKNTEARLFGHSILFLAEFMRMNKTGCQQQFNVIKHIEPDHHIYPWPIGRKVSTTILYRYIVENNPIPDLQGFLDHYTTIAYAYDKYLENGVVEFEMSIMVVLVLIEEYELLIHMIEKAVNTYNIENPAHEGFSWLHQHQNTLAVIFLDYAKFKTTHRYDAELMHTCEKKLDNYVSSFDDYQYLILMNYFLFEYLLSIGENEKAMTNFRAALNLSRFAEYTFFEVYLLCKGSNINDSYREMANDLIRESKFNAISPSFKPMSDYS